MNQEQQLANRSLLSRNWLKADLLFHDGRPDDEAVVYVSDTNIAVLYPDGGIDRLSGSERVMRYREGWYSRAARIRGDTDTLADHRLLKRLRVAHANGNHGQWRAAIVAEHADFAAMTERATAFDAARTSGSPCIVTEKKAVVQHRGTSVELRVQERFPIGSGTPHAGTAYVVYAPGGESVGVIHVYNEVPGVVYRMADDGYFSAATAPQAFAAVVKSMKLPEGT